MKDYPPIEWTDSKLGEFTHERMQFAEALYHDAVKNADVAYKRTDRILLIYVGALGIIMSQSGAIVSVYKLSGCEWHVLTILCGLVYLAGVAAIFYSHLPKVAETIQEPRYFWTELVRKESIIDGTIRAQMALAYLRSTESLLTVHAKRDKWNTRATLLLFAFGLLFLGIILQHHFEA